MNRSYKSQKWSLMVRQRDNYTCKRCGKSKDIDKVKVQAHHIKEYHKYQELRYILENGITLCDRCHHDMWYYSVFEKPKKKHAEFLTGKNKKPPELMKDNEYINSLKNCIE